ncbi:MAG TPA: hypothetical protein VE860_00425 [Chthoniobacterales bacterium]|jgi:hypothetical protein|nr:hypothetical protein [Chthoniobacterales bacterium]
MGAVSPAGGHGPYEISQVDEEAFHEWMADKWELPHSVKLNTLFYDAKNNTRILADYNEASQALLKYFDKQQASGKNMGVLGPTREKLVALVNAANVALPDNIDITDGKILNARIVANNTIANIDSRKSNKELRERQQKAYSRILESATNLINFVLRMESLATAEPKSVVAVEFKTIVYHDIPKTLKGYPSGICHKEINAALTQKINLITTFQI